MSENTNDSGNPVLTFEGKEYLINDLSKDIKESINGLSTIRAFGAENWIENRFFKR